MAKFILRNSFEIPVGKYQLDILDRKAQVISTGNFYEECNRVQRLSNAKIDQVASVLKRLHLIQVVLSLNTDESNMWLAIPQIGRTFGDYLLYQLAEKTESPEFLIETPTGKHVLIPSSH